MNLVILAAVYLALLVLKTWLALRAAAHVPRASVADQSEVAVAQPILSGDPALAATLEDNLRALPAAHFIWLVDADDGVAEDVCSTLKGRYANVRIDVVSLPEAPDGDNPKLFKLERARPLIRERVLLVLDDDTRMPAETLAALTGALGTHTLATALPAYRDDGRWPSRLLAEFVNNNAALTYLPVLNVAPAITIKGMAYALETATLDRLGGFAPILRSVTDDLALADRVRASGGRLWQAAAPVWVHTTIRDGGQYARQMHRWYVFALVLVAGQPARMRLMIAALNATPSLLLWSLVLASAWRPSFAAWSVLGLLAVARGATIASLQQRLYGRRLHRPVYSIASELLQPLHLIHACIQRTITWRTRRYRVGLDQTFRVVR